MASNFLISVSNLGGKSLRTCVTFGMLDTPSLCPSCRIQLTEHKSVPAHQSIVEMTTPTPGLWGTGVRLGPGSQGENRSPLNSGTDFKELYQSILWFNGRKRLINPTDHQSLGLRLALRGCCAQWRVRGEWQRCRPRSGGRQQSIWAQQRATSRSACVAATGRALPCL